MRRRALAALDSDRIAILLLLAFTVVATACDSGEPTAARSITRDSAGITIIENAAPAWDEGEGWQVDPTPAVDIGVADGDPSYEFGGIYDLHRLPDGRIAVGDDGNREVRFFSAAGEFLLAVGGAGEGPGEFGQIGPIATFRGDSILVFDYGLRRINILGPDGGFARVFPLGLGARELAGTAVRRVGAPNYWATAVMEDSLIFVYSPGEDSGPRELDGTWWDSTSVFLMKGDDTPILDLGRWPVSERVGRTPANRSPIAQFFPRMALAVTPDLFWHGTSDRYEVRAYDSAGKLQRIVRRTHEPVEITSAMIASFEDDYLEFTMQGFGARMDPDQQADYRRRIVDNSVYAPVKPAFAWMLADEAGNLWIREYSHYSEPDGDWSVFDTTGRWLGQVRLPEGLDVSRIGADWVLGTFADELGVDHVRLHRITKN